MASKDRWEAWRDRLLPRLLTYGGYAAIAVLVGAGAIGEALPVDYRGYAWAASQVAQGASPYRSPAESQAIWREVHRIGERLERGAAQGSDEGTASRGVRTARDLYLYPPTLATALSHMGISSARQTDVSVTPAEIGAAVGAVLLLLAVAGFSEGWLRALRSAAREQGREGPSAWWLLLVLLSWDVIASFSGVNVELLLVALAFGAAAALWRGYGSVAALVATPAALMKPYYLLFFAAFGALMVAGRRPRRREAVCQVGIAGAAAATLIGLEVLRWPAPLRADFFEYLSSGMDYVWMSLPVAEQTPLSTWNRTPLQVLITAGVPPEWAPWLSFGLWAALLGGTAATIWKRRAGFPLVFGLAYALLFFGRPVSWTLPYLDFALLAAWPALRSGWERKAVGAGIAAVALSHWVALVRTASGADAGLFTLQSASFPWETLTVLPLAWGLLLTAARRQPRCSAEATRPEASS